MRQAGSIPDHDQAQRFVDYLLTQGITAKLDQVADGWAIWVRDEDQMPQAVQELEGFVSDPDASRYRQARSSAESLRKQQHAEDKERRRNFIEMRDRWNIQAVGARPLTIALLIASILVGIATNLGEKQDSEVLWYLWFAPPTLNPFASPLRYIDAGQVWRLVTPIFIHKGPWHLAFNMLMLYQLGSMVEIRRGTLRFGLLVLVLAIVSNYGQYFFPYQLHWGSGSTKFGGMSGVLYGLFGYAWMKSRFEPQLRMFVHPNTVAILLIWFVVCWTGALGDIANWAHATGLVSGVVIGYAPVAWRKLTRS
jgi:GlpG protein